MTGRDLMRAIWMLVASVALVFAIAAILVVLFGIWVLATMKTP